MICIIREMNFSYTVGTKKKNQLTNRKICRITEHISQRFPEDIIFFLNAFSMFKIEQLPLI